MEDQDRFWRALGILATVILFPAAAVLLALLATQCAPSILTPPTGPGTTYPCGVQGLVCTTNGIPNHGCCLEGEVCGGDPKTNYPSMAEDPIASRGCVVTRGRSPISRSDICSSTAACAISDGSLDGLRLSCRARTTLGHPSLLRSLVRDRLARCSRSWPCGALSGSMPDEPSVDASPATSHVLLASPPNASAVSMMLSADRRSRSGFVFDVTGSAGVTSTHGGFIESERRGRGRVARGAWRPA